jgi:apolipoprotein D and lipocalin family protein
MSDAIWHVNPIVDFDRYSGTWYEIARTRNPFEPSGSRNTKAIYRRSKDGSMEILNITNPKDFVKYKIMSVGIGIIDSKHRNKMRVKILVNGAISHGSYTVALVDDEYRYAIVRGDTVEGKNSFWILCREKTIESQIYHEMLNFITQIGGDFSDLIPSYHDK